MFDIYKNSAWQSPDNVQRPESGARRNADSAKRYKEGAWQELWADVKFMIKKSDDITTGLLQIENDGLSFNYFKFATKNMNGSIIGTLSGGGTIVFYVEGEWVNPTINFEWEGGFIYYANNETYQIRVSAGDISIYTRTPSGTESTQMAVQTAGSTLNGEGLGYVGTETGAYNGTIPGTFDRIGLSIRVAGYSGNDMTGSSTLNIANLLVDGRKIGFPADAAFNRQAWS